MDSQSDADFDNFRSHILPRTYNECLLLCGSFYEQSLQYAMSYLTDLDHLFFDRTIIAITEDQTVSHKFNGEILSLETDKCHLGFARLLRSREKNTKYVVWNRKSLHGPAIRENLMTWQETKYLLGNTSPQLQDGKNFTADYVYSVVCPHWPPEASEWTTRERCRAWPTTDIIDKTVKAGCHLVPKSHQSNPNDDTCWRFSFSQAELILLNSWNAVQKYVYHILRLVKSDVIEKCGGEEKTFLCTYHVKTLMLWACEEKPSCFWNEDRIEAAIEELLMQMIQWLIDKRCPNYFIRENNMLDYLPSDLDVSKEVGHLLVAFQELRPRFIDREPMINLNRGKMLRIRISDKSLLLLQLGMNRRVFFNVMNQTRERCAVKNLCSGSLLSREVEALFEAVQLHRLMTSSDSSSDETEIRRKIYETDALSYFQKSYDRHNAGMNGLSNVSISLVDSLPTVVNKLLHRAPSEHSRLTRSYSRTDEADLTDMEIMCQILIAAIDGNHRNPSFLISAAYYANFYYTALQDYRQALKMCEKALTALRKLEFTISLDTIEPAFSNEILCVFVNRQYINIYDSGIQVVFGFLLLCMTTFERKKKRESDRMVRPGDVVFQLCPVEFLKYIQIRCRSRKVLLAGECFDAQSLLHAKNLDKLIEGERLDKKSLFQDETRERSTREAEELFANSLFHDKENVRPTELRKLSDAILSAAARV